jgi:nitrogen fixation NifU-like protein
MSDPDTLLTEHFLDPFHRGPCERPTHAGECECAASGCHLQVELVIDTEGRIVQAWFEGLGCQVCEAVASLLMEYVENRPADDILSLDVGQLVEALGLHGAEAIMQTPCLVLPLQSLARAIISPLDLVDDGESGTNFGGPSLREEC